MNLNTVKPKTLVFSNGIWKHMPHDNFLINVAKRNEQPLRPLELHLEAGKTVRVGDFVFRQEKFHASILRESSEANGKSTHLS